MMTVDPLSAVAILVGLAALVFAIRQQRSDNERRRRNSTLYLTREQELEQRVATLERDIASLQRMLTEKQNEIDTLKERIRQLERDNQPPQQRLRREILVVGYGADKMLEEDVAALRGVREFQLSVLRDVSKASLATLLERHRARGEPVRFLHLAVHAGPAGLIFSDGLADGLWLSRQLSGVAVLLVAGCESDRVADLLAVVPAVVSMRDEINNRDASIFSRAFWTAIGQGKPPNVAVEYAIERSPTVVGEMVDIHQ